MHSTLKRQKAQIKGHRAEWFTSLYLKCKGYEVLERRYKTPVGEIDILARTKEYLIAVEVKRRNSFEDAAYAVTFSQKKRIENALLYYLSRHPSHLFLRFDVVLIAPMRWPCHIQGAWNP